MAISGTALEMAGLGDAGVAEAGGVISEDVLQKLFLITPVDRPFIDNIGSITADNFKKEFTDKVLSAPVANNSTYENEDLSAVVNNTYGQRYYNLCQPMKKVVKLSQRGRDVKTTYNVDEYLQQIMDLGEELRRDEEAAAVSRNAATQEVPATTKPLMAGAATWAIHNHTNARGTAAADAVLDGSEGLGGGPTTAPTAGALRAMTETLLRDALKYGWENGAMYDLLMSTGDMIETIASYMFTSSARVATLQTNAPQGNRSMASSGNGAQAGGIVAQGSVNMFVGNFGTVVLCPNRQMFTYTSAPDTGEVVDVLLIDTRYPAMAYLTNYTNKVLSSTGMYDQEVLYVDTTLIPGSTYSISTIADIDPTADMTA